MSNSSPGGLKREPSEPVEFRPEQRSVAASGGGGNGMRVGEGGEAVDWKGRRGGGTPTGGRGDTIS